MLRGHLSWSWTRALEVISKKTKSSQTQHQMTESPHLTVYRKAPMRVISGSGNSGCPCGTDGLWVLTTDAGLLPLFANDEGARADPTGRDSDLFQSRQLILRSYESIQLMTQAVSMKCNQ